MVLNNNFELVGLIHSLHTVFPTITLGPKFEVISKFIRDGIRKGGLSVFYLEKNMFLNVQELESVLLSPPSQIISSKYKGKYKLYDVEFGKKDPRQTELF